MTTELYTKTKDGRTHHEMYFDGSGWLDYSKFEGGCHRKDSLVIAAFTVIEGQENDLPDRMWVRPGHAGPYDAIYAARDAACAEASKVLADAEARHASAKSVMDAALERGWYKQPGYLWLHDGARGAALNRAPEWAEAMAGLITELDAATAALAAATDRADKAQMVSREEKLAAFRAWSGWKQ